jgi:hypothetical protein
MLATRSNGRRPLAPTSSLRAQAGFRRAWVPLVQGKPRRGLGCGPWAGLVSRPYGRSALGPMRGGDFYDVPRNRTRHPREA